MKSTTHFAMAHILAAALQKRGIHVNQIAFAYGNIAPDYMPTMIVNPHFGKVCTKNIEDITTELAEIPLPKNGYVNAEYSKRLGIMCHYICDYFCYAHNGDFNGNLRQHANYENELDTFMRHYWFRLLENGFKAELTCSEKQADISIDIDKIKKDYFAAGYSTQNDLNYALNACLSVITSIVDISKNEAVEQKCSIFFDRSRTKGYATGKCYVFKMFLLRNRNNNVFFIPDLMSPLKA